VVEEVLLKVVYLEVGEMEVYLSLMTMKSHND
jgi:hypothetical protein